MKTETAQKKPNCMSLSRQVGLGCGFLQVLLVGCGGTADTGITGVVEPANNNPVISRPLDIELHTDEEAAVVGRFAVTGAAPLANVEKQSYSVIVQPEHGALTLSQDKHGFSYLPQKDFFGTDVFVYSAGSGLSATVTILVANLNDSPILHDQLPRVIAQGSQYFAQLAATDPDNDRLDYYGRNLPPWLNIERSKGQLSGMPTQSDVGLYEDIELGVSDSSGLTSEIKGITIEVLDINDAPTINPAQFPTQLDARQVFAVNVFPDDPDGDLVTLSVEHNDFLTTDVSGGTVHVTVADVTDVTEVNVVILAMDRLGSIAREIIPITLYPLTASGRGHTIQGRSKGAGLHMVVLGDGYRADQQILFRQHTQDLMELMRSDPGVAVHFSAWNIHAVEIASIDSGIDDNMNMDIRDTAFGTGYFCLSIQRLICGDQLAMFDVAIAEYPHFDQIVVLVNDTRHGGSGGSVAIASANSPEIALHELGHSIAGLADEYVDSLIPALHPTEYQEGRFANVSTFSDADRVPWSAWIDQDVTLPAQFGDSGVGIFEGAFYQAEAFFRPTSDSRMRNYQSLFGPVNSEQWALSVYNKTNPILDFKPVKRRVEMMPGQSQTFSVTPLFDESVQQVQWHLNGQLLANSQAHEVTLTPPVGEFALSLSVQDVSGLIRKPPPNSGTFSWDWEIVVQ